MESHWSCYLICSEADSSLYCGIALDPTARLTQHNDGTGAKRTRGRGPWRPVWQVGGMTHREAARLEYRVKKLPRSEKVSFALKLIQDA